MFSELVHRNFQNTLYVHFTSLICAAEKKINLVPKKFNLMPKISI